MEKILGSIGEFSGALGDFRAKVTKVIAEVSSREEKLALAKIEQDTRSKELDAREVEIKKVEDVIALSESAKITLNEIEVRTGNLAKAQEEFNNNITKKNAELNVATSKCNQEREIIKKEHEALDKRVQDIAEQERKFVTSLLEKIRKA